MSQSTSNNNCNAFQTSDNQQIDLSETNKFLKEIPNDFLYHLGLSKEKNNLEKMFGDVKFVCMGGSNERMEKFAKLIQQNFGFYHISDYTSKRFAFYKIGPILSISHGMGMPSFSILLHEIIKLLHYAKCKNPIMIRIGTCGGIDVEPGTIIVTKEAYNGLLENCHEFIILGERVKRKAVFDENLANEFISLTKQKFPVILGNTMAADDFYEGQGRIDGAICTHTNNDKLEFLQKLQLKGIKNIEMEATVFAAITHLIGIKALDVCVALINRLNGDQVTVSQDDLHKMEDAVQEAVLNYIKFKLLNNN